MRDIKCLGFWLLGALTLLLPVAAPKAETLQSSNSVWAQTESDLPADPNVLFGTLPNGMRYAILKNNTPQGQVSFRLRLDVGSIQENESEQGMAHFLEHLAFRGSTHVPDAEVFRKLERLGAALGADTNAFTAQTETVYKFDLPKGDEDSIDTALMLLRETSSELQIREEAVDSERKVVLSEERLRDDPHYHMIKDMIKFFYKGQPLGERLPIGEIATLKSMNASSIRSFYEKWYRPERATLIVTGDIELQKILEKIKTLFSDWVGKGEAGVSPLLGPPPHRSFDFKNHSEAGVSPLVSVIWVKPFRQGGDTKAYETEDTLRQIAISALNQRLQDKVHAPHPPFISAELSYGDTARSLTETNLVVTTPEGQLEQGLKESMKVILEAKNYGFTRDEIQRQITAYQKMAQKDEAEADKRTTPSLADSLVAKVDAGEVFMSPKDNRKFLADSLKLATVERIHQALKVTLEGSGPLLFWASPQETSSLDKVFNETLAQQAQPQEGMKKNEAKRLWPYTNFGKAGKVVKHQTVADLGLTLVQFENGVYLNIKPTKFKDDQILISLAMGDGMLSFAKDEARPLWALDKSFLIGGLEKLSYIELEKLMTPYETNISFSTGDDRFYLSGSTRPKDLAIELQLMTAYLTHPGWREEAFEESRSHFQVTLPQQENSPSSVMHRDITFYLRGGDLRWKYPTQESVKQTSLEDVKTIMTQTLQKGRLEITIVGNVNVRDTITQVAKTFGTLPKRDEKSQSPERANLIHLPESNKTPITLTHKGREDQSIAYIAFPIPDARGEWSELRDLRLLQLIMRDRLFDSFRTKVGGTYSPSVGLQSSIAFPDYGYFASQVETPPDKISVFYDVFSEIVKDLQEHPVSEDELSRAKKPYIEGLKRARLGNDYWLGALSQAQTWSRQLDLIRQIIPELEAVSSESVQKAAQKWLSPEKSWKMIVLPSQEIPKK
jgi:zinc protease